MGLKPSYKPVDPGFTEGGALSLVPFCSKDLNSISVPRYAQARSPPWTAQAVYHTKVLSNSISAHLQSFLSQLQRMLGDLITGHVGSHDEDGIFAVNGLPLAICQATLVRMRDGIV